MANILEAHGPRLPFDLTSPSDRAHTRLVGLVDTGADITAISEEAIVQMGWEPVGTVEVVTANGSQRRHLYDVRIRFPGAEGMHVMLRVAGLPKMAHSQMHALLGRDLLALGSFQYDGPTGEFRIEFDPAEAA